MKKRISALLCALLWAVLSLGGCGGKEESIPRAETQFYVLDEAGVLDADTEAYIVSVNDSLCEQTGAQVVVVCVHTTGVASTDDYAYELFNTWKIGDEKKNNGILILLSIGEEDYWMLTGKGLEESFSGGIVKLMLNRCLEPDFAVGQYDAGVRKLFDAVVDQLEVQYAVTAEPKSENTTDTDKVTAELPQEDVPYREASNSAIIGWVIIIVIIILLAISFSSGDGTHRRRRHVTHSAPRPRKTTYPYGTRRPNPASRPTVHRPNSSYGGKIGGSTRNTGTSSYGGRIGSSTRSGSSSYGGRIGGSSTRSSYGGKIGGSSSYGGSRPRSGGGGMSRGGGAGRR